MANAGCVWYSPPYSCNHSSSSHFPKSWLFKPSLTVCGSLSYPFLPKPLCTQGYDNHPSWDVSLLTLVEVKNKQTTDFCAKYRQQSWGLIMVCDSKQEWLTQTVFVIMCPSDDLFYLFGLIWSLHTWIFISLSRFEMYFPIIAVKLSARFFFSVPSIIPILCKFCLLVSHKYIGILHSFSLFILLFFWLDNFSWPVSEFTGFSASLNVLLKLSVKFFI